MHYIRGMNEIRMSQLIMKVFISLRSANRVFHLRDEAVLVTGIDSNVFGCLCPYPPNFVSAVYFTDGCCLLFCSHLLVAAST